MSNPTPGAPVPPDELMAQWWSEDVPVEPRWSRHMARRGAAWGWEQAISDSKPFILPALTDNGGVILGPAEREELAGLLERAWSAIDFHVDHNEPDFALRDELRAAAERLRGGAE
jgi:hypothetical protein